MKRCASLLLFVILETARLQAQGGPPMITDDPGTPGDGHWEINTAITVERRPGERSLEMPLLDLNYGVGERLQLKYEAAWRRLDDGGGRHDGLSNSLIGVKWRFFDGGEQAWSASMYPQLEFRNPGSHSVDRGLAEPGTAFELPFQVMKDFGWLEFNADVGYVWRSGGNEWFGGVAVGREVAPHLELAAELHVDGDGRFRGTALTANVGARLACSERCSLLASIGRELHHAGEPRATLVGYLGMQTRF